MTTTRTQHEPDRHEVVAASTAPAAGAMWARYRALDWAATPLGPVEMWPDALLSAVRLCLDAAFPMCVLAGTKLVLVYNDAYRAVLGAEKDAWALGRPARDVWRELWDDMAPDFARVLGGAAVRREDARLAYALSPIRTDGGAVVGALEVRAEAALMASSARQRFLLALSDRLRPLGDAVAIQREAAFALGTHVAASRVGYAEILDDDETSVVTVNYTDGVRGILGSYKMSDYSPSMRRALLDGRTVVRGDVANDATLTAEERAAHEALQVGATVDVPLTKDGRLVAVLFMHYRLAHAFTAEEVALLEAVAERTREAVERARSESALRASEARLRLALGVAELGTWSFSLTDGSGHLDERAARIVGLPAGDFADVASAQAAGIYPDDLAAMQRAVEAGAASGEPFDLSYRVVHPDGSVRHVASRAVVERDGAGRPVRLVGTNRDVTGERVAAERARLLQALTAAFGAALTPEAVVRVALEHAVPAFGASTGVLLTRTSDGEGLTSLGSLGYGGHLSDLLARVPLDAPLPAPTAVRERRSVWVEDPARGVAEYPALARVYGETGAQATAALPLVDAAGEAVGVLVFNFRAARPFDADTRALFEAVARQCVQALDRARLFAAEREARREAEEANRAKSDFLAMMSHELRTPLNAIGGYADLMTLGIRGPVTPEQQADLARIQASQRHLLGLINEVLNYAKLETGTVHYDLADVDVCTALAAAEALVAPQADLKRLTLSVAGCPPAPGQPAIAVRADAEKLRQILVNLLSNAIKFTPAGGRVSLDWGASAGSVHVSVCDTGIGIPVEHLDRIFDPFVQVRSDLTRTAEGTGLGLAISRDLARGMSGELVAASVPGEGSVFTLTLPRA